MRTLYNEDGTEVQVPDEQELQALQEAKSKVEAIPTLEAQIEELKQAANPNFKAIREKEERLKSALKSKGIELDKDGLPIITPDEEQAKIIDQRVQQATIRSLVNRAAREFGENSEAVIAKFNKLTAGEEVNEDNYDNYLQEAIRAVGIVEEKPVVNPARKAAFTSRGTAPLPKEDNFAETNEGSELGKRLGLKSFTK